MKTTIEIDVPKEWKELPPKKLSALCEEILTCFTYVAYVVNKDDGGDGDIFENAEKAAEDVISDLDGWFPAKIAQYAIDASNGSITLPARLQRIVDALKVMNKHEYAEKVENWCKRIHKKKHCSDCFEEQRERCVSVAMWNSFWAVTPAALIPTLLTKEQEKRLFGGGDSTDQFQKSNVNALLIMENVLNEQPQPSWSSFTAAFCQKVKKELDDEKNDSHCETNNKR